MNYEMLGKWVAKRAEEDDAADPELERLRQQVRIATAVVAVAAVDALSTD